MSPPKSLASFLKTAPLFAALAASQSAVIGNLDDTNAELPYGLDARTFADAVSSPNATNSYPISGFGSADPSSASLSAALSPTGAPLNKKRQETWGEGNGNGNNNDGSWDAENGDDGSWDGQGSNNGGTEDQSDGQDSEGNGGDANGGGGQSWDDEQGNGDDENNDSNDSSSNGNGNGNGNTSDDDVNSNDNEDTSQDGTGSGSGSDDTSSSSSPWSLRIHVTADVPLSEADPASYTNDEEDSNEDYADDVTQLTVFSLSGDSNEQQGQQQDQQGQQQDQQGQQQDSEDTEACAIIFRGLNDDTTRDAQGSDSDGGECDDILSEECIDDLQKAASESGGSCEGLDVPRSCEEWIDAGTQSWGEELTLNSSTSTSSSSSSSSSSPADSNGRFFAHASYPRALDSDEAWADYAVAVTNVWPVLLSWKASDSEPDSDSESDPERQSVLRCVRASNVEQGSTEIDDDDVPDRGFADEEDDDEAAGDLSSDEEESAAAVAGLHVGVAGAVGAAVVMAGLIVV